MTAPSPVLARDCDGVIPGYFDTPWPGEDGGPRRQMAPRGSVLAMSDGEQMTSVSRPLVMCCMPILRASGEVFVQGMSPPGANTTSWVERINPESLACIRRSPDLPGGPWWPGGVLAHANGYLYVTHGRFCHKLDPDLNVVASRQLPQAQAYNSLIALSDGNLVMKNLVSDGSTRSSLELLEPERLEQTAPDAGVPEGSIARISRDISDAGEFVYVIGDHTAFRFRYESGRLERDASWQHRYRTRPDDEQSYGWDPVIAGGSCWFMDNGAGRFTGSFAGGGLASGPLHLLRISTDDAADATEFTPFGAGNGVIVNPPMYDPVRGIAVAFDSGNCAIGGFRAGDSGSMQQLWRHGFGASNHFILYPDSGEIVVNDCRDGAEHVVVLDIESGRELGRCASGSAAQSVTFQSPGWNRDVYTCSFTTLTRTFIA